MCLNLCYPLGPGDTVDIDVRQLTRWLREITASMVEIVVGFSWLRDATASIVETVAGFIIII